MGKPNSIETNLDKFLYFYADCVPVSGASKMALYDLTRTKLHFFPPSYFEVINLLKKKKIKDVINLFNSEDDLEQFSQFVDYVISHELAHFLDDISRFPPLDESWDHPSIIQNSIVDIRSKKHNFKQIFEQLDHLGCQFVQLRFYSMPYEFEELMKVIELAYHKSIASLDILITYDPEWYKNGLYLRLLEKNPIIASLYVHSAEKKEKKETSWDYHGEFKEIVTKYVNFTDEKISSCDHCGIINKKYLSLSGVQGFMENVLHNGCLNRKISIDENGNIKNCPSMNLSYGTIANQRLKDVVTNVDFQKWGRIKKDEISECKDCELRYMCSDCRVYTKDPADPFSKPAKCSYNPYSGKWEA